MDLESMRQGLLARRPVFPPSEHSSLSRKGFEGLRAGASAIGTRERHSMPLYEHVFMSRQDASAQQVEELTNHLKGVIEQMGGKIAKLEQWGVKSLAYRLRKNRKAHYTFMNLDAPPAVINEIERQERLNEEVLRYLTVRVEELEEGPSVMMRKVDRDRERDERGGGGFRDRDRGGFRGDRDRGDRGDRGERGDFRRDRDSRPPRDEAPAGNQE
jgi:small subunit ribosomal protein S6